MISLYVHVMVENKEFFLIWTLHFRELGTPLQGKTCETRVMRSKPTKKVGSI
jgi:hypothetical protein